MQNPLADAMRSRFGRNPAALDLVEGLEDEIIDTLDTSGLQSAEPTLLLQKMGGAASNVPVELAWKRIRDGKLGTRNACYLAFDCFHPQWDPRHLWLIPIAQAVQVQMVRNAPYADHLVRFEPTLSPANLAPSVGRYRARRRVGAQER